MTMNSEPNLPDLFYTRQRAPYYIFAPAFTQKSAGPRMLHILCHTLNSLGCEAYVTAPETSPKLWAPPLTKETLLQHRADGQCPIAVYPEILPGNPLDQPVVARWLLNRAGHLKQHAGFTPDELLFYWDEWVLDGEKNAVHLFFPGVDRSVFNWEGVIEENRRGFCYYAHKYLFFGHQVSERVAQNGISLCQDIPRPKEEIAEILRSARVLYCYEPSAITLEANACGCPVLYIDNPYLRQFGLENLPSVRESDLDFSFVPEFDRAAFEAYIRERETQSFLSVRNFIEITQAAARTEAQKAQLPEHRLKRAIAAFNAEQLEEAAALFSPLLDALPGNPLPPAYLAFLCAQQGLHQEALDFIRKSEKIAPDRFDLKAALGESFLKSGHPGLAVRHLQEAVDARPDLFSAYPALAWSLFLTGASEEALSLLQAAAGMPSEAQANIRSTLLEILSRRGDLSGLAHFRPRFAETLEDALLAAQSLMVCDEGGERFIEALSRVQSFLGDAPISDGTRADAAPHDPNLIRIAFMVGDSTSTLQLEQLAALLLHLPPERFFPFLAACWTREPKDDVAWTCAMLADSYLDIAKEEAAAALEKLLALKPDILINLEPIAPSGRLDIFLAAPVAQKLLWGEAPCPPIAPGARVLAGAALDVENLLPAVSLEGLGEVFDLPELAFFDHAAHDAPPALGCLVPAEGISRDGWRLLAETINQHPAATLALNLEDRSDAAHAFIRARFSEVGIDPARLLFLSLRSAEDYCFAWQSIDLGLLPPAHPGGLALPTCLWMGRPCLAPASHLPWAARPTALLKMLGREGWIAADTTRYAELARQLAFSDPRGVPDPALREAMKAQGLSDSQDFARRFARVMTDLFPNPSSAFPDGHHPS